MTDRELLKLAAKAAGALWVDETFPYEEFGRLMLDFGWGPLEWNPLTDDGAALRLAVKLDIEFYQGDDDGSSVYAGYWSKSERRDVTRLFAVEPISGDPYAATRRAIVRAAAEIGKEME
jgi:hypothetical protein